MRHSRFASRHLNKRPVSVLQQPLPHILPNLLRLEPRPVRRAVAAVALQQHPLPVGQQPQRTEAAVELDHLVVRCLCRLLRADAHAPTPEPADWGVYSYGVDYAPHHLLMRCRQEAQGPYVASRGAQHALVAASMSLQYVRARVKALVDPETRDSGAPGKRRVKKTWHRGQLTSARRFDNAARALQPPRPLREQRITARCRE